ncbi:transketolase [Yoonia sediminilitoris]|uniref:Transketolase n=1 Tax=Yoonia sediminilitoris TaxID=1286148 RepID=A0A2T6KRK3_9RHOB|nr:transketolase [Yoonia sediminilitoris]RCW99333.1 transketolase [Yoonia sediminilitoris]
MKDLATTLDLGSGPAMRARRQIFNVCEQDKITLDIAALRTANPDHWMKAAAIRALTLDAVAAANSGHSGMPMGMADVATVLFEKHLNFDPKMPEWPDRDRFILSAGHGSMLLYSLMYLTGYEDMPLEQIKDFRQWGAKTAGHPEFGHARGIETTTGPLGQGIANSVGFAIAEEIQRATWGKKIIDHNTYVIAGDGCLMEGVSHEAIGLAGMQKLSHLIVLFDNNNITIDGTVDMADVTDQNARFAAAGWHVQAIDGHDPQAIDAAITAAKADPRPSMIACKTHIAIGHAAQDTSKGHGALTDPAQLQSAKEVYGWNYGPFEVPADIKSQWEAIGARGAQTRADWEARFATLSGTKQAEFKRIFAGEAPKKLSATIRALKKQITESQPKVATRKSSEMTLEVINPIMAETIGGSADLTGSNNTKTADLGVFNPDNRKGRYIYYGVREHGMAAAMNGMALHGGAKPYGGTFMCFTDYARGAMRLSALMGVPATYVMTHDSIGLGEDGPTHQPVEHLAMMRATPNTHVFRPADTVETAESWELALTSQSTPSVLCLSRQGLPTVRTEHKTKNLTAQGAYVLADATGKRQAILMATGSEVSVALAARDLLQSDGIGTRVVSMPCWELFAAQDESYRRKVLPAGPVRVGIEAGVRFGWDQWLLGERGNAKKAGFVGMQSFGASAPAEVLFEKFGITAEDTAAQVKALLGL